MKAIVFSFLLACLTLNVKSQVFFSQNFSAGGVYSDYVNETTPGTTKFTSVNPAASVTASITNGKFRLTRVNAAANNAGSFNIFNLTTPLNPASKFTKLSFEFTLSDNEAAQNGFGFFLAGEGIGSATTPPANDNTIHSSIAFNATANPGEFSLSNATSNKTETTTSAIFKGTQTLTWFINNSGSLQTYVSPAGTSQSVSDDTFDLWVGNTLVFGGLSAIKTDKALTTFKFVLRNQQGKLTLDFDDFEATDLLNSLPISLLSFSGESKDETIKLNWSTVSEKDNSHFDILRSIDGLNFNKIGEIKGSGDSNVLLNYQFIDKSPLAGNNYYKLRQLDFNGDSEISKTIVIKSNFNKETLTVLNSKLDELLLSIYTENQGKAAIVIADLSGKIIINKSIELSKGYNSLSFQDINFLNAMYIGKMLKDGTLTTIKFIK